MTDTNVRLVLTENQIRELLRNLPQSETHCLSSAHWQEVCALRDNAFDPVGVEPGGGNGTLSPEVVRRVRAP